MKVLKDIFQNVIASSYITPQKIRRGIYSLWGHKVKGYIGPKCFFGYGKGKFSLDKGSSINYKCFLDLGNDIAIGKNCNIAYQVTFVNSTHEVGSTQRRAGRNVSLPIIVKDGCWIGANATIMGGVTIGEGCIIGTGALVIKDCEPNGLYIGFPAKRVKDLK